MRARDDAAARVLRVGDRAMGNWQGLGTYHKCTVLAVSASGFRVQYDASTLTELTVEGRACTPDDVRAREGRAAPLRLVGLRDQREAAAHERRAGRALHAARHQQLRKASDDISSMVSSYIYYLLLQERSTKLSFSEDELEVFTQHFSRHKLEPRAFAKLRSKLFDDASAS